MAKERRVRASRRTTDSRRRRHTLVDHRKAVIVTISGDHVGTAHALRGLRESVVAVERADDLTDPQIVAKVREHFGSAR
jgi:hypothetical protein